MAFVILMSCKKDKQVSNVQNNNNSTPITEYIKGQFGTTFQIFSYKPLFIQQGDFNAFFDTATLTTSALFVNTNNHDNILLTIRNINITTIPYPYLLPSTSASGTFFYGNVNLLKHRNDTLYNYYLTTIPDSQILLDSYDSSSCVLKGKFSGKLYGVVMDESPSQVSDSMSVTNGEFSIKISK